MNRQEYLNTHTKEEILNKALAYREIAQDLQERITELEKLMSEEMEREGIYAGALQSKATLRELLGVYFNDPQKVLEYPLDKNDIVEGFHKRIYLAVEALAKLGYREITGFDVCWYLEEHHKIRKERENDTITFIESCKKWNNNTDPKFIMGLVEDMKKWTLVRESFKQGKDISKFYTNEFFDYGPMEEFGNTSLEEMQEYFDGIPAVEKINDLLPELY